MNKSDEQFIQILNECKEDPNIIGFMLGGSRGKGFESETSDYDPRMIVKDEVAEEYEKRYNEMKLEDIDLVVTSLMDFKNYAAWGSPEAWDRYDFSHITALVDKTGEIQNIIDDKGKVPDKVYDEFVRYSLDGYINGVYRSVKWIAKDNEAGARLEAVMSIPFLLDVVFALHNKRLKPFYGYLKRELDKCPLEKLPWGGEEFLGDILDIMATADLRTQQKILLGIEDLAGKEGFQDTLDGWEGKDGWAIQFRADQSKV